MAFRLTRSPAAHSQVRGGQEAEHETARRSVEHRRRDERQPAAAATTSSAQVDTAVAATVTTHRRGEPRRQGVGRAVAAVSVTTAGPAAAAGSIWGW